MPNDNDMGSIIRQREAERAAREEALKREIQRVNAEYQQQQQLIQQLRTQNEQVITKTRQQIQKFDEEIKQLAMKSQNQSGAIKELTEQKEKLIQSFSEQLNQVIEDNKKLQSLLKILGNPLDELLLKYSDEGDIEKVKSALNLGANIETQNSNGNTPHALSMLKNHVEVAEFLSETKEKLRAANIQPTALKQNNHDRKSFRSFQQSQEAPEATKQAIVLQSQIRGFFARKNFQIEKIKKDLFAQSKNILDKFLLEDRYDEMHALLNAIKKEQFDTAREMINRVNKEDSIKTECGAFNILKTNT